MQYILTSQDEPPITPADIADMTHARFRGIFDQLPPRHEEFWNAQGDRLFRLQQHANDGATWITHFCQERGNGWLPASLAEFTAFYRTRLNDPHASARHLLEPLTGKRNGWIKLENELIILSREFVGACYATAPSEKKTQEASKGYDYILGPDDEPVISPAQIDTKQSFRNMFGCADTEGSARWIVRFCQMRHEGWQPILEKHLVTYFQAGTQNQRAPFFFYSLIEGWIRPVEGQRVVLSKQFVERCYQVAPA